MARMWRMVCRGAGWGGQGTFEVAQVRDGGLELGGAEGRTGGRSDVRGAGPRDTLAEAG